MISGTTRSALRALFYIADCDGPRIVPLKEVAERLDESPTYVAKIAHDLVRAGILRSERGRHGGVSLGSLPENITLLDIVEACQGEVRPNHCRSDCASDSACCFHLAAVELCEAVRGVLGRWTLAGLMRKPTALLESTVFRCKMTGARADGALKGSQGGIA